MWRFPAKLKMKIICKKEVILIFLLIGAVFGCVAESEYLRNDAVDNIVMREPLSPPTPDAPCLTLQKFRVVSLKQLQKTARQGKLKNASAHSAQNMGGLTTIEGYYIDRKNKDLLILGKVDDRVPSLMIDDFVVALRCAWKKYAVDNVFTPPGCSIDPSVRILKRLNAVKKQIMAETSVSNWKNYQKDYEETCAQRHTVRVLGMPFHTHFASVLVKADYDMKRIVDGSDAIDIPGVADLYALNSYDMRQSMLSQNTIKKPTTSLSRFWFKPDQYHFQEQRDWVVLDRCEISLLTEQQYLTEDDKIKGSGRADPFSEKVADRITTYYTYIAQKRRVFRQLKELMRMYIVLEAMHVKDAHLEGGLDLDYLLNAYQVPKYYVSTSLLGQSRYIIEDYERETFDATERTTFVFPMCGGVNFGVFLRWDHFSRIVDARFSKAFRALKRQQPQSGSLFWDVVIK